MNLLPNVNKPSSLHRSFIAQCLKAEVDFLQGLLKTMKQSEWPGDLYIKESLKSSVRNFKDLVGHLS